MHPKTIHRLTIQRASNSMLLMSRLRTRLGVMVLLLSFLTACPTLVVDPPEVFGISAVISTCSYLTNDYSIFCKAFSKTAIALEIQGNLSQTFSILFPSNTAMTTYFTQNSFDVNSFLSSPGLIAFVKKHVALGVLSPGVSLPSWAGTSISISGTTSFLIVNRAIAVTTFPFAYEISPRIWLYAIDKTIE